jgi:hypothetical protein
VLPSRGSESSALTPRKNLRMLSSHPSHLVSVEMCQSTIDLIFEQITEILLHSPHLSCVQVWDTHSLFRLAKAEGHPEGNCRRTEDEAGTRR